MYNLINKKECYYLKGILYTAMKLHRPNDYCIIITTIIL